MTAIIWLDYRIDELPRRFSAHEIKENRNENIEVSGNMAIIELNRQNAVLVVVLATGNNG